MLSQAGSARFPAAAGPRSASALASCAAVGSDRGQARRRARRVQQQLGRDRVQALRLALSIRNPQLVGLVTPTTWPAMIAVVPRSATVEPWHLRLVPRDGGERSSTASLVRNRRFSRAVSRCHSHGVSDRSESTTLCQVAPRSAALRASRRTLTSSPSAVCGADSGSLTSDQSWHASGAWSCGSKPCREIAVTRPGKPRRSSVSTASTMVSPVPMMTTSLVPES